MKKFISLLLVLIMITSLVPPSVLALDDPEETSAETGVVVDVEASDTSAEDEISIENEDEEQAGEPAVEPVVDEDPVIEQEDELPAIEDGSGEQEQETEQPENPSTEQMTLVNTDGSISVSGVLPSGTVLSAERIESPFAVSTRKLMSAAKSRSAEVATDDIANWNYIAFYDIKLVDDNVSVQPDGTATVTISGLSFADGSSVRVLHILDSVDAIRNGTGFAVSDSGFVSRFPTEAAAAYDATGVEGTVYVELINASRINSDTIQFATGSFSIYAIIEDNTEVPRAKYIFQNADGSQYLFMNEVGEWVDNQILKNGEALQDVGTPSIPDGTVFQGWYIYVNGQPTTKIEFGQPMTVTEGSTLENTSYIVRPFFGEVYFLTFYDDIGGHVILSMIQVPKSEDPDNPTVFNFNEVGNATVTDPTVAFVGWTTQQGGTEPEYTSSDSIEVTDNMVFYPVFKTGHWIYFVSAPEGSGATYIAPVFVPLGQNASGYKPSSDPTWKDHTFIGWYTHDTEGNEVEEFGWNTVLTEDITLYGKWRADDVKYIISIYKQNVNDSKNAADADKTYTFFRQYEFSAPAGTITVYTPEEYKTMVETDPDNFTGFVFNPGKSDDSAELKTDGSTNLKLYYDRVTVTMNFIGYPGGTDTVYLYTALDSNDNTTSPQYGQVNGVYKELTLGEPTTRYEYSGYTGSNYEATTLYGTVNGGMSYFLLSVTGESNYYLATRSGTFTYTYTEYTNRPVYYRSGNYGNYSYSAVYDPVYNNTYYTQSGNRWGNNQGQQLYWQSNTTYTFTNQETGEVYWTGVISNTNRPSLFTRTEVQVQTWLYDGQPYYGARYSRSSSSETGLVYTGLYGQTLEQNGYTWPAMDANNNPCYWQYDNNQGELTGMSYLGEFILPDGVADPNGQIINLHYNSVDDSSVVSFYLMDTAGNYLAEPNDSGIVSKGGTFYFSEKYDGFNVTQYRRYYMDGNTKVYIDRDGNRVTDPNAAWATAVVDASTPLRITQRSSTQQYYWAYTSTNGTEYQYDGTRYTEVNNNNYDITGYRVNSFSDDGNFNYNTQTRYYRAANNNNGTQYGIFWSNNGTNYMVALTQTYGYPYETIYLNLEIRYARKQWMLEFVDSLDGHSSLTDSTTGELIASQTVYYNEELEAYEPAETVVPKSTSAGYVFKGWFKDQACTDPFVWTDNMPNADLNVYAGWEQEWYYVKLIPDGGTLLTSQATYFWETYGGKVVEYGTITKNFVEDPTGPYVYYFGEFDTTFGGTDPVDRNWPQATYRYALYFTNDGTKVVVENADGTKTESATVTAYRNKVVDGHYVYDDEGQIIQEPYEIPASTIYQYGVDNGFIDTSKHYKYEKDAYALVGWYDVTDGTRKVYSFDGGVNKDTILQAVWRKVGEYTVGYSTNGVDENGNPLNPAVTVTSADVPKDNNTYADNSDTAVLGTVTNVPEGYEFRGWYYDGKILQKGDAFTLKAGPYADDNKTIWLSPVFVAIDLLPVEVTYITYDGNGGTTTVESDEDNYITVNTDKTTITEGALQINATQILRGEDTFTRDGYTLIGWAFDPNANVAKFEFGQEVGADNLDTTGNTLYAVWQRKTYTVTINKVVPNSSSDTTLFAFADPSFSPVISSYQGTFGIRSGESKVYTEVPYGTTFRVLEDTYSNYETTIKYSVDSADDETKNVTDVSANNGQTFTVDGNITVTVTNTLKLTQLHIKKTGMETGESAIFTVTGKGIENGLTVVVPNGQTVTIDGVFVGETYTVSEMDGWTWKYSVTGASSISKVLISATSETDNLFSFENELSNDHWLSGEGRKINVFRKAAPPDGTTD